MRGIVETSSMLVLSGTLLASCSQQGLVVLECPTGAIDSVVSLDESDELDLLLVIDDSLRMAEEQASLSAQLPRLISALAFGDRDGDGTVDFAPPRSIHVGIVTTDMGTGASVVMSCPGGNGDDGVLQTGGPYCASSHPTGIFELRQGESVPGFASMLGCMPIVGTAGCNFEQALKDLDEFEYIWVLAWLHLNEGWNVQVIPPRGSKIKRGLFATRAPHRPNPIGLSALKLIGINGRKLKVRGIDLLDGTPVLDIKPYIPYTDSFPNAKAGWLEGLKQKEGDRLE